MKIEKIYIGGWYQRTSLHLTEIWQFLKYSKSELNLSQRKILELRNSLDILKLSFESGPLYYIDIKTKLGIDFRIYEDGLIILEKKSRTLKKDLKMIKEYYDEQLSPALSYIFSRGAPVPKELANIKTILPYFIVTKNASHAEIEKMYQDFKENINSTVAIKETSVYRSTTIILINNIKDENLAREIVESQIFFREFKTQLHRYLMIHRILWEKIEKIKAKGQVKGKQIDELRNKLSRYQKTVNLIDARIEQMGSYVKIRQQITDMEKISKYLKPLLQFRFDTVMATHEYIKYLWKMTDNYLTSALEIFNELQVKRTQNTISSLQLITAIGVMSTIIGLAGRENWPKLTIIGLSYVILVLIFTWVLNSSVSKIYKSKKYLIKGGEIEKKI